MPFTAELRRDYEAHQAHADSGSRPVITHFVNSDQRERRFMPFTTPQSEYRRFASFAYGVRQVVRRDGKLEPAF